MANIHAPASPSFDTSPRDTKLFRHADEAYVLLHVAFVIAPVVAGLDKFLHLLTNWDKYLAPAFARTLPMSVHAFMGVVGTVEILAGLIVLFRPRIGAYVVALWLAFIVLDLMLVGAFDIALRDVGLCLGALALGRLSIDHDGVARRGG